DALAAGIDAHAGGERRQLLEGLPAVVESNARERLVAAGRVRLRAAPAAALVLHRGAGGGRTKFARRCRARRHRRAQGEGRTSHGCYLTPSCEQIKNISVKKMFPTCSPDI